MSSVFFLCHAEIGDNITCIGAINYLLTIYKNVYFVCQYNNLKNLKILYSNPRIFLVPFKIENKILAWYKLLYPRYKEKNMDILFNDNILTNKTIITRGHLGCQYQNKIYPTKEVSVKDVSGAGDTFLSGLVVEYTRSKNIELAINFAQECTTIVVQKIGVSTI